jgi:Fe-S-cluster containining protein
MAEIACEITIAGQPLQFRLQVPSGPATWNDLLPFMRALVQVGSEMSQQHFASHGQPVSCKAGCGICCRQRVPISEFEAHRLRQLVDNLPEPRRTEVIARFRNAEERCRAAGLTDPLTDTSNPDLQELTRRSAQYVRLMIACPFLENESCSIYEERPLKCREYLVVSPAEHCAEPERDQIVGLPLPLKVYLTTLHLDRNPAAPRLRWVPLNQLMSWTDTHEPEPATRTGPELFHQFMSSLLRPATSSDSDQPSPS